MMYVLFLYFTDMGTVTHSWCNIIYVSVGYVSNRVTEIDTWWMYFSVFKLYGYNNRLMMWKMFKSVS